jgi:hypothetical protein
MIHLYVSFLCDRRYSRHEIMSGQGSRTSFSPHEKDGDFIMTPPPFHSIIANIYIYRFNDNHDCPHRYIIQYVAAFAAHCHSSLSLNMSISTTTQTQTVWAFRNTRCTKPCPLSISISQRMIHSCRLLLHCSSHRDKNALNAVSRSAWAWSVMGLLSVPPLWGWWRRALFSLLNEEEEAADIDEEEDNVAGFITSWFLVRVAAKTNPCCSISSSCVARNSTVHSGRSGVCVNRAKSPRARRLRRVRQSRMRAFSMAAVSSRNDVWHQPKSITWRTQLRIRWWSSILDIYVYIYHKCMHVYIYGLGFNLYWFNTADLPIERIECALPFNNSQATIIIRRRYVEPYNEKRDVSTISVAVQTVFDIDNRRASVAVEIPWRVFVSPSVIRLIMIYIYIYIYIYTWGGIAQMVKTRTPVQEGNHQRPSRATPSWAVDSYEKDRWKTHFCPIDCEFGFRGYCAVHRPREDGVGGPILPRSSCHDFAWKSCLGRTDRGLPVAEVPTRRIKTIMSFIDVSIFHDIYIYIYIYIGNIGLG